MISVIIPTVKFDHLKKVTDTIKAYTSLERVEVIAVCNGMDPLRRTEIPDWVKVIWHDKMLGYPKAVNLGIVAAGKNDVILMNDDVELLLQPKDLWLEYLIAPFKDDPKLGMTGPIMCQGSFPVFFCVYIKRELIDAIGLLDENFGTGAGEDADYYIRAVKAGWKAKQVPFDENLDFSTGIGVGPFPIYHKGEGTVHDRDYVKNWVEHCNKNCDYLEKKHPGNNLWRKYPLKLNLACGPKNWHMAGYTNIDLYEPGADLALDIRDLSRFKDESVDEIYAGHVIEHFTPGEVQDVLTEWHRVLKMGAKMALELPDMEGCCKAFIEQPQRRFELLTTIYGAIQGVKVPHLYGYTFDILINLLWCVGFDKFVKLPQQHWHQGENMRVECIKVAARKQRYFSGA